MLNQRFNAFACANPNSMLRVLRHVALSVSSGILAFHLIAASCVAQQPSSAIDAQGFEQVVAPFLKNHCVQCHQESIRESGIRVDHLDGSVPEDTLSLWSAILKQLESGEMPPEDEKRPPADQQDKAIDWIRQSIHAARLRPAPNHGTLRRLTVAQYRQSLIDLLGVDEVSVLSLPPDPVSKDGFTNNGSSMPLSPLQLETYLSIAMQAVSKAIVDESKTPTIQFFRMDLGKNANPQPIQETLVLGANNHLLPNSDFMVTEPALEKPFPFHPHRMQRQFRFIEGYQGNDTVREWRNFEGIAHSVFACMRGSEGYPKGLPYESIERGLLLRPAIPSPEIFGESSTYGPHANFKISLRELPSEGQFRIQVRAAKYADGMLLDSKQAAKRETNQREPIVALDPRSHQSVNLLDSGLYCVSLKLDEPTKGSSTDSNRPSTGSTNVHLSLGDRRFTGTWTQPDFLLVRLPAGELPLNVYTSQNKQPANGSSAGPSTPSADVVNIAFHRVTDNSEWGRAFLAFEQRTPKLGVHLGLRRDCGSTLSPVGGPQTVDSVDFKTYTFEGTIEHFPSPDVEKDNVNYLAGIREIGVRSEYTDGRDMPRLILESITFEGPFLESWPPPSHENILGSPKDRGTESENLQDRARTILDRFATRAFRRPITRSESDQILRTWSESYLDSKDWLDSIRQTIAMVLASPQFLFIIETSHSPDNEKLNDWELASKLSYFLWNSPPDKALYDAAKNGALHEELDKQVDRMIDDPRFQRFVDTFSREWLSLDKLDVVETDMKRFPHLTKEAKLHLGSEPSQFLRYLILQNRPVQTWIAPDFMVANEVTASYYGLGTSCESGFDFVPISLPANTPKPSSPSLGGILTQAGILAGLSDGRESNPVKRGAWFARKIVAMPPDDPPPNVPKLEDLSTKTLRERLEIHRNAKGCTKCHMGIDPWGVAFEPFDAAGLPKSNHFDARAVLPDGTSVDGYDALKSYLIREQMDQIAYSIYKHLMIYALGRSLRYNELEKIRTEVRIMRDQGYPLRTMLHAIVRSELFLNK